MKAPQKKLNWTIGCELALAKKLCKSHRFPLEGNMECYLPQQALVEVLKGFVPDSIVFYVTEDNRNAIERVIKTLKAMPLSKGMGLTVLSKVDLNPNVLLLDREKDFYRVVA